MRATFLNCPIDLLTTEETVGRAAAAMRTGQRLQHVALNVAKFVNMQTDPVLREDVIGSDLVGIDGMGIVVAARLLGLRVPERVAGIDLFRELLAVCEKEGFRPFLLGAKPEILQSAMSAIKEQHPRLEFAGFRDGYFSPAEEEGVVAEIIASKADCLFIGMPDSPERKVSFALSRPARSAFHHGRWGQFRCRCRLCQPRSKAHAGQRLRVALQDLSRAEADVVALCENQCAVCGDPGEGVAREEAFTALDWAGLTRGLVR